MSTPQAQACRESLARDRQKSASVYSFNARLVADLGTTPDSATVWQEMSARLYAQARDFLDSRY